MYVYSTVTVLHMTENRKDTSEDTNSISSERDNVTTFILILKIVHKDMIQIVFVITVRGTFYENYFEYPCEELG